MLQQHNKTTSGVRSSTHVTVLDHLEMTNVNKDAVTFETAYQVSQFIYNIQ